MTVSAVGRPGYFGRKKDEKIAGLNAAYGLGNWTLMWRAFDNKFVTWVELEFQQACKQFYEESYFQYLEKRDADIKFICSFKECYDNEQNNIFSGLDYTIQNSYSTHIQDIAIRNVLVRLGCWFTGERDEFLQIRSKDSLGFPYGPGNIPFYDPSLITQPSLAPTWAGKNSVEDFWQSNKWIVVRTP